MKELPVLLQGWEVRAILDGRKTQMRHPMKPQPEPSPHGGHWWACDTVESMVKVEEQLNNDGGWAGFAGSVCPLGQLGDRLWVRETWKPSISHSCAMDTCDCEDVQVEYLADGSFEFFRDDDIAESWTMPKSAQEGNDTPSIHMPRWASRITLEITDVRVERIQDISDEDVKAEGTDGPETSRKEWEACAEIWDQTPGYGLLNFAELTR